MQSAYANDLPNALPSSTLNMRALRKERRVKIAMIVLVLFILGMFILIFLEEFVPMVGRNKTETAPTTLVTSHDLSADDTVHRQGYKNNMYLKLLNETNTILNRSNCWFCSHLPHHGDTGVRWIVEPFPLPTACFASVAALYYECWINSSTPRSERKSDPCFDNLKWIKDYDIDTLGPLKCSVFFESIHMTRAELLQEKEFPYKRHIPLTDAAHIDRHGSEWVPTNSIPPSLSYTNKPISAPFCLKRTGVHDMGNSETCDITIDFQNFSRGLFMADSAYFVCGILAYPWLPRNWGGTCYMAMVLPGVYVLDKAAYAAKVAATLPRPSRLGRAADEIVGDTSAEIAGDVFKSIIPYWGAGVNSAQLRHLSRIVEVLINSTADMIGNLTFEQRAIRLTTLQNRLALDMILVERGGVCELVGSSCCTYIPDTSTSVFEGIQRLHKLSTYVHEEKGSWDIAGWFQDLWRSWGWKLLMFLLAGLGLVVGCCLCINCLPAILSACVSCCLSALRVPKVSASVTNAMIMQDIEIQNLMNISFEDMTYDPMYTALLPSTVDPYLPMSPLSEK